MKKIKTNFEIKTAIELVDYYSERETLALVDVLGGIGGTEKTLRKFAEIIDDNYKLVPLVEDKE